MSAPNVTATGVRVRWRWSFLILIAGAMFIGWFLSKIATTFFGWSSGTIGYAISFTGLVLVAIVVHEAGHALVGVLVGHRLLRVTVGLVPSVGLAGEPRDWRRVVISAAGPLAEAGVGWLLLRTAPWSPEGVLMSPAAAAGLIALANAAMGIGLPVPRNSDSRKIWRGIGQTVQRVCLR